MKIVPLIVLLFSFQAYSQTRKIDSIVQQKKLELKISPIALLDSENFIAGFEYFKNKDISFGVLANFNLNNNNFDNYYSENVMVDYQISPFIRYSLSKKQTSFFYIESYLNANGGKYRTLERLNDEFGNGYYTETTKKYNDLGIGFGGGYKFYIKNTIGVDFNFGWSRNLFNDASINVIPKGNILFSYRF